MPRTPWPWPSASTIAAEAPRPSSSTDSSRASGRHCSRTQARLLRLILESEGFSGEVAGDGPAALARLGSGPFDLVVSDVLMPGVTGFELCRMIKGDPALCDVPVVLVTTEIDLGRL